MLIDRRPSLFRLYGIALGATLAAAALGGGCSDSDDNFLTPGAPCDNELAGQCGASCLSNDNCPAGQYCSAGLCTADCTPLGGQCPAPLACTDVGQCGGGAGGSSSSGFTVGNGGGNTGGSGTGGSCGSISIDFEPVTPTVVVLIDRSGSMNTGFGNDSRWDTVYDVLMDPAEGVLASLESQVRFGLALYTGNNNSCPDLDTVLPPALNNRAAIDAVYSQQSPNGDTPTGESLAAVADELDQFTEPGPKLIILATDGDPDTCVDPDDSDGLAQGVSELAAWNASERGIQTVIIAVGNAVNDAHQQRMANAGAGLGCPDPQGEGCPAYPDCQNDPTACAPTYEPASKQGLIDDFTNIINGQRGCVFSLDGEVVEGKECEGTVIVNGMAIQCNDPNGWQLNSPTEIEFVGTTCATILEDENVTISAEFPCDSVVIPQ